MDDAAAVLTEQREPTLRVYRLGSVTPDEDAAVLDNLATRLREYFTDRLTMAIRVQPNGEVVPEAIEAIRSEVMHVIRECGCDVAPGERLRIRVVDREVRIWTEREAEGG